MCHDLIGYNYINWNVITNNIMIYLKFISNLKCKCIVFDDLAMYMIIP